MNVTPNYNWLNLKLLKHNVYRAHIKILATPRGEGNSSPPPARDTYRPIIIIQIGLYKRQDQELINVQEASV